MHKSSLDGRNIHVAEAHPELFPSYTHADSTSLSQAPSLHEKPPPPTTLNTDKLLTSQHGGNKDGRFLSEEEKCEDGAESGRSDIPRAEPGQYAGTTTRPADWSDNIFLGDVMETCTQQGFGNNSSTSSTNTARPEKDGSTVCEDSEDLDTDLDFEEHDACDEAIIDEAYKDSAAHCTPEVSFFEILSTTPILSTTITTKDERMNDVRSNFAGYCLDSGAARSVTGRKQYWAL